MLRIKCPCEKIKLLKIITHDTYKAETHLNKGAGSTKVTIEKGTM